MPIACLQLRIRLHGCRSLKEKRRRLAPLLARLRREFNIAVAETGLQDVWQSTEMQIVTVSNDAAHAQRSLQALPEWIEARWPDFQVEQELLETLASW